MFVSCGYNAYTAIMWYYGGYILPNSKYSVVVLNAEWMVGMGLNSFIYIIFNE